jgi:hypothetical protein
MKKIYFLKKKGYVDLYYNDLHGLMKTYKELKSNNFCLLNKKY